LQKSEESFNFLFQLPRIDSAVIDTLIAVTND